MNTVMLHFNNSNVCGFADDVYIDEHYTGSPNALLGDRMRLAFCDEVRRGFILNRISSLLESDYYIFCLHCDEKYAEQLKTKCYGDGVIIYKNVLGYNMIVAACVSSRAMHIIDDRFDNVFFKDCVDIETIEYDGDIDDRDIKEFEIECEVIELRNALPYKNANAVFVFSDFENELPSLRGDPIFDLICFSNKITHDVGKWNVFQTNLSMRDLIGRTTDIFRRYDKVMLVNAVRTVSSKSKELFDMLNNDEYIMTIDDINASRIENKYYKVLDFFGLNGFSHTRVTSIPMIFLLKPSDIRSIRFIDFMNDGMKKTNSNGEFLIDYSIWKANGRSLVLPSNLTSEFFILK
jgi:hypothetical protein